MSVIASKPYRAVALSRILANNGKLYIYSGTMPTASEINGVGQNVFITTYNNVMLGNYLTTFAVMEVNEPNQSIEMITAPTGPAASNTGTATWFMFRNRNGSYYDYWISDSISVSGGNGILQLNTLSFVAGNVLPNVTDLAMKFN